MTDTRSRVVAVDMDGTLCNEMCWTPDECIQATPNVRVINKVAKEYREGFVVVYTARKDELIPSTLEWLRRNNVRYHAISNIKIPAEIYIDDKAINVNDY